MKVCIPAEINTDELRVAATPKTVIRLIKQGFEVFVQNDAGIKANFSNADFTNSGATVLDTAKEIYSTGDIILKVLAPSSEEIEMMHKDQVILSYLWPAQNPELLEKLSSRGINAIAMDAIPRISRAQKMDVLSSMANIAGYRSVIESANYFGRFLNGQITAAGKVDPAKVLVIGAGVAGLAAIGTARSLGAIVRAFDTRMEVEEQIQSMGAQFLSVDIEEDGSTDSGYSKVMSPAFIEAEMALFKEQAKEIDIIITTAQIPGRKAPLLVLKEAVDEMKPGSVIVDLAASTGGNCELTKDGEIITTENGVIIVGKLSQLPSQASQLYGNNLCHLLDDMGKAENFAIDMDDDVVSRAMVTYNGSINWPPKPLPVSPQKKKEEVVEVVDEGPTEEEIAKKKATSTMVRLLIIGAFLLLLGQVAPADFMQHFTVFVLSVFIGWQVIWNVTHALHTPLMAVTNAISGIIVIGGLELFKNLEISMPLIILASIAILVASINIVGGFFVTHRMLKMFKK